MGDPAGIGPEIIIKALGTDRVRQLCRPLVVGDAGIMARAVEALAAETSIRRISQVSEARFAPAVVDVLDLRNVDSQQFEPGRISALAGHAAFESLVAAIELAMTGAIAGIVTTPIHKESINIAGHHFAGHTEILAHYTNTKDFAMLLVHGDLRVIHVSTHVPLRTACALVKKERVLKVIYILHDACRDFGIDEPRIGVAGLNPHASDGGLFGAEEANEIAPAVEEARAGGLDVDGPVPPDTLFAKAQGGFYDGLVAMYHDQGHIPFKLKTFTFDAQRRVQAIRGVNITLGLQNIGGSRHRAGHRLARPCEPGNADRGRPIRCGNGHQQR